jgi:hypothetical protein
MPQKRRNQCAVCGEWIRLYQRGVESCYQNDRKEAACPVVAEKLWRQYTESLVIEHLGRKQL